MTRKVGVTQAVVTVVSLTLLQTTSAGFCDDPAGGFRSVFSDEFSGKTLDETKWNIEVAAPSSSSHSNTTGGEGGHGRRSIRSRDRAGADCSGEGCIALGSCRDAACTKEEAFTADGALVLRSSKGSGEKNWTTGAVNTWGKAAWRAGEGTFRVCVSAKLPGVSDDGSSQGLWPAHWLMPHDDTW